MGLVPLSTSSLHYTLVNIRVTFVMPLTIPTATMSATFSLHVVLPFARPLSFSKRFAPPTLISSPLSFTLPSRSFSSPSLMSLAPTSTKLSSLWLFCTPSGTFGSVLGPAPHPLTSPTLLLHRRFATRAPIPKSKNLAALVMVLPTPGLLPRRRWLGRTSAGLCVASHPTPSWSSPMALGWAMNPTASALLGPGSLFSGTRPTVTLASTFTFINHLAALVITVLSFMLKV